MSSPSGPYVREAGQGPGVVCIHANASTSAQWRGLVDSLSADHHVLAPDSYGVGRSPEWPSDREITLSDEARLLEPVFESAGTPFTLVGHSFGGAVALVAGLSDPRRIRAMVLYEPTLFAVWPEHTADEGIQRAVTDAAACLDAGDVAGAAGHFIDFWMEPGSLRSMPPERRAAVAASTVNVRRGWHALSKEPTPLEAFAALGMPILYLLGERSPPAAHAVADVLCGVLPNVRRVTFEGLGHMGPVTHPDRVNAEISKFIRECEGRRP